MRPTTDILGTLLGFYFIALNFNYCFVNSLILLMKHEIRQCTKPPSNPVYIYKNKYWINLLKYKISKIKHALLVLNESFFCY